MKQSTRGLTIVLVCTLAQVGEVLSQEATAIFPTGVIYRQTKQTGAVVPEKLKVPGVPMSKHGTYQRHPYYIFVEDPKTQSKYLISDSQLKAKLTLVPGSAGMRPKTSGTGDWLVAKYNIDVVRSDYSHKGFDAPMLSINDPRCEEQSCFFVTGTSDFQDLPSSRDQFTSYVVDKPKPTSVPSSGKQPWGSAFTPKVGTPLYYMYACWDVTKLTYMNYQAPHCIKQLLSLPAGSSRDYDQVTSAIALPYGWLYDGEVHSTGKSFTSMMSNSRDVMNAIQRTTGYHVSGSVNVDVPGITKDSASFSYKSSNAQMKKFENMHQNKTVFTRSQYSHTTYALVVDKINGVNGGLAPPFRTAVASMLPALKAGTLDDETVIDFVKEWGTHYPYAVTYGNQGSATFTYTETQVKALIQKGVNYSKAWEANVSVTVFGSGGSIGGGSSNETDKQMNKEFSSIMSTTKEVYACSGGASCDGSGKPTGDEFVPVFLDLRPISELLAPPYYDEPEIVLDLRDRVLAAIKKYAFVSLPDAGSALNIVQLDFGMPNCNKRPCKQLAAGVNDGPLNFKWIIPPQVSVSEVKGDTFLPIAHMTPDHSSGALTLDYAHGKPAAVVMPQGAKVSLSGSIKYKIGSGNIVCENNQPCEPGVVTPGSKTFGEITFPSRGGQTVWLDTPSEKISYGVAFKLTLPVKVTDADLADLLGVN